MVDGQKFFDDARGDESAGVGDIPTGAVATEAIMVSEVAENRVNAKELLHWNSHST